jgi:hypothetical protein
MGAPAFDLDGDKLVQVGSWVLGLFWYVWVLKSKVKMAN